LRIRSQGEQAQQKPFAPKKEKEKAEGKNQGKKP